MIHRLVFALAAIHTAAGARFARRDANTNSRQVGVVMNPGGGVDSVLYEDHMKKWQQEAEAAGFSIFFKVLDYWFDIPLPGRLSRKITGAIEDFKKEGMASDAPVFLTGHSMGGGVAQDVAQNLFERGFLSGLILQASYIGAKFFPPMAASYNYPVPTLTIGAELNFGAGRITRIAAAAYRQQLAGLGDEYPLVVVEGMNHMQFATGFEKEDLKPEKSTEAAQAEVAQLAVDFMSATAKFGGGSHVKQEVARTNTVLAPLFSAFELEGSKNFNVPNQKGAPNNECPRGVCPTASAWTQEAQEMILGAEVLASGVNLVNNYADLEPYSWDFDREDRKPFITEDLTTVQAYVMAAGDEKEFERDVKIPVASYELLGKFVSRQDGNLRLLEKTVERDGDLCKEINAKAYEWALTHSSEKARTRFEAHGIPMEFGPTAYQIRGPSWVGKEMEYKDKGSSLEVISAGLFTEPGDKASRGNHYCKLLSPARAMEYIYVDGLKKNLWKIW